METSEASEAFSIVFPLRQAIIFTFRHLRRGRFRSALPAFYIMNGADLLAYSATDTFILIDMKTGVSNKESGEESTEQP